MFSDGLKDYIEHLSYVTNGLHIGFFELMGSTVVYLFHSFLKALTYMFTFQWVFAFRDLPVMFRQNYHLVFQGKSILDEGLLEPNFYPILNTKESKQLLTVFAQADAIG